MHDKTLAWDPSIYLDSPEAIAAYVEAAVETGDHALLSAALGDIARAKGMTQVAREAGLTRESLYRSLSADGDPKLSTLLSVLRALGVRLEAKAIG